jgi:hypothetical protein
MRKSIVLMTLAALTAALATGCASSGEAVPAGPLVPHVVSDYVVRPPLAKDVPLPPPKPFAPATVASQAPPQGNLAPVALSRPTRRDR